jgi:predicted metal-binding membrane protein
MLANRGDTLDKLSLVERSIARLSNRPGLLAFPAVAAMVATSWVILITMGTFAANTSLNGGSGPGGWLLRMLPDVQLPSALASFFALCVGSAYYQASVLSVFLALWLMWFLMALAMMLPSATPMIRTYCDIAGTAREKELHAVNPLVLLAGYLFAWATIAAGFACLTLAFNFYGATEAYAYPVQGMFAPFVLLAAGFYQFSGLKHACLAKCRNPFPKLFGKWSNETGAVFKLGIEEGLNCAGCCWALMLVMFAVGIMNVFWMGLLAVFAVVEKTGRTSWFSTISGVILLVWAAALMFIQH